MNTRIICLSLQQNHINRRGKMTNKVFFLILAVTGLGWSNKVTSR